MKYHFTIHVSKSNTFHFLIHYANDLSDEWILTKRKLSIKKYYSHVGTNTNYYLADIFNALIKATEESFSSSYKDHDV